MFPPKLDMMFTSLKTILVFALLIPTFLLTCIYFSLNLYDDVFRHGKKRAKKQPSGSIKNYHKNSMDRDICIGLKIKKDRGNIAKTYIGAT